MSRIPDIDTANVDFEYGGAEFIFHAYPDALFTGSARSDGNGGYVMVSAHTSTDRHTIVCWSDMPWTRHALPDAVPPHVAIVCQFVHMYTQVDSEYGMSLTEFLQTCLSE
jgi:hypothetical protein